MLDDTEALEKINLINKINLPTSLCEFITGLFMYIDKPSDYNDKPLSNHRYLLNMIDVLQVFQKISDMETQNISKQELNKITTTLISLDLEKTFKLLVYISKEYNNAFLFFLTQLSRHESKNEGRLLAIVKFSLLYSFTKCLTDQT